MGVGSEALIRGACVLAGYSLHWLLTRLFVEPGPGGRRRLSGLHSPVTEQHKMVLVVNDELKMGKGKTGAQCAHAAVGAVERAEMRWPHLLDAWELNGQAKICLRCKNTTELKQLARKAERAGLPVFMVADAGRTQVAPGSKTVLAIGPAPRSALDAITGDLRLL